MRRLTAVFLMAGAASLRAGVGDPQIKTNHPYYQGELSCSTYERVAESSEALLASLPGGRRPKTDTERLVALWAWRVMHHQHADGNDVFIGPGARLAGADGWTFCRDGLVGLFSHSTGLCYSIHAQFTPFVQKMTGDWRAAAASLVPGHTSFEGYTDGKWRWADMTCGSMFFEDRASFNALGIQDMIDRGAAWCKEDARRGPLGLALMPFGDSFFPKFKEEDGKQKFFGYLGMPIAYHLRAGESFTRWHTPAGDDGVEAIWSMDYKKGHSQGVKYHGMHRRETFLNYGPPGNGNRGRPAGDGAKYPFNYSCKGAFVYAPDLSDPEEYREGLWSESGSTTAGGWLHASRAEGEAVFVHGSPYQIAAHVKGAPDRNWAVKTDACDLTALLSGTAQGTVPVSISLDNGRTWEDVGTAEGAFSIDFSDRVKGRFQYLLRLKLGAAAGLRAMQLRTVVQVGPAVFPQLKGGGSEVTFRPGGLGVVHGGPYRQKALGFHDPGNSSGEWTAFRIPVPGPVRSVHGVASSGGKRGPLCVETSVDGKTWDRVMGPYTLEPGDKRSLNSSIWGNGTLALMWGAKEYPDATSKAGWVRFQNMGALEQAAVEVYATYEVPATRDLKVTFGWTDAAGPHTASTVFDGSRKDKDQVWKIPTGAAPCTESVKFECVRRGKGKAGS